MSKSLDYTVDWLADAALTPDQRIAWNRMRGELVTLHTQNQDMAERIKLLESPPADGEPTILTRPDFNREVARMLAFDERYGGVSSVLYFNIDQIDYASTRYGRAVANAAMRETGSVLMRTTRGSDIVGRLAPDEFGVLLARCDSTAAWHKGEKLAMALHQALIEVQGCKLNLRVSYGAYTFQDKVPLATGLQEAAHSMTRAAN